MESHYISFLYSFFQGCQFVGTHDEIDEHKASCPNSSLLEASQDGLQLQIKVPSFT